EECAAQIGDWLDEMAAEATADLRREEEVNVEEIAVRRRLVELRLRGQESAIAVEYEEGRLAEIFEERYRKLFGYYPAGREVEAVSLRVVVSTNPRRISGEDFTRRR